MFVYVHVHPYINTSAVINRSGKECMVIFISTECAQTYIDFHGENYMKFARYRML